jgi:GNAT superfamily N-acetyltransferase
MAEGATPHVRPARRGDAARLADLRFKHLAETARLEPRLHLLVDAREKVQHSTAAWLSQEDRVVYVAEAVEHGPSDAPLSGYAAGLSSVWPPIFRTQHVGEVLECFVPPAIRGQGVARALLRALEDELRRRGAEVLRAPVPARNEGSVALFRARGFAPLVHVMQRGPGPE